MFELLNANDYANERNGDDNEITMLGNTTSVF